jgi:hypothetical protein
MGLMQSSFGQDNAGYEDLLQLFAEWREFESPPMLDGAPDYTAAGFAGRYESFLTLRNRLHRIDPGEWPISQQVDWHIVRAGLITTPSGPAAATCQGMKDRRITPWSSSGPMNSRSPMPKSSG